MNAFAFSFALQRGFNIPVFSRLLAASRKIVGHFHHSVVATTELKRRCLQMELAKKTLVKDCAMRWNSSLYMLQRLLQLMWPVTAVLSDDSVTKRTDRHLDLKAEKWSLASDLVYYKYCNHLKLLQWFSVMKRTFRYLLFYLSYMV